MARDYIKLLQWRADVCRVNRGSTKRLYLTNQTRVDRDEPQRPSLLVLTSGCVANSLHPQFNAQPALALNREFLQLARR
jgi:hypothetical protein